MKLENKVAIVTGAGSGIGRAIAQAFNKEGANVTIVDCNLDGAKGTALEMGGDRPEHLVIEADVSKVSDIERFINDTVDKFGRLDIIVNNAGIEVVGNLTDFTEEQWESLISVNLKGVFFGMSRAIPHMMKQKKGKIINISSLAAVVGSTMMCLYSTAKAGIIGLTRAAAVEYASYKINVNAICPGFIRTGMTEPALKVDFMRKMVIDRTPLETIGEPDKDIAPLAVYLASEDSDFVTGQYILVDGGYSIV